MLGLKWICKVPPVGRVEGRYSGMRLRLFISGMTSVHAARAAHTALASVQGITWAEVKLGEAEIECERPIDAEELRTAIEAAGLGLSDVVQERRTLPIREEE